MSDFLSGLYDIKGKRVLVIGGSGVLGGALVRGYAQAGARIAFTSTTQEKADRIASEIQSECNSECIGLKMNAQSPDSVRSACEILLKQWSGLDVMVNAAGGNSPKATVTPEGSFFNLDPAAFEDVLRLNYLGGGVIPLQVFGEAMVHQKSPVSIIHISSMSALLPLTRVVAYSSAKAAIDNLTRWCAVEFAQKYGRHIRVNAIAPGFFLTEQNRFLLTDKESGELTARGKTIIANTPMKEFGKPEELIGAAIWLASSASAFVTGIVVPIDGGFSAFSGV